MRRLAIRRLRRRCIDARVGVACDDPRGTGPGAGLVRTARNLHGPVMYRGVWGGGFSGGVSWAVRPCVCENSDGWLVAGGPSECMLIRSSTVWLLPFTFL